MSVHVEPLAAATEAADVTVEVGLDGPIAHPRLFGSFVEHLGRSVYGGIYEPSHPESDTLGFRQDVLRLVRELGVTTVRYPGGNFVSGYDWRDGIGPKAGRPRRLDLAWKSIESNEFGTDEFIQWCKQANVEPMMALNLGLGTVKDALELLEYTNHPGGTDISDLRIRHGHADAYNVRLWCLGNELDGPWQLGAKSSEEYAALAATTANAMRMFDENLELVAVGSSNADMPTFGTWERDVLAQNVALVDYLSCHIYFYDDGDTRDFLRSSDRLHEFLTTIEGIIEEAKTTNPAARDVKISLDEWNVWNYRAYDLQKPTRRFEQAPRILEDEYTLLDAVVVGSLLQTILAHAETVSIAALAQLVNVIGPIRAEEDGVAWRQTTFYPFAAAAKSAGWNVLPTAATHPDVLVTVTQAPDAATWHVYLTNRDEQAPHRVSIPVSSPDVVAAWMLHHPDLHASNTQAAPNEVSPLALDVVVSVDCITFELPPVSWGHIEVRRGDPSE